MSYVPKNTLKADALVKLKKMGVESPVLDARLAFATAQTFKGYVKPLVDQARVTPGYLPTQASGRWSVTKPPLINFPDDAKAEKKGLPKLQGVVYPDIGAYWLCWDWNGMHVVFMAAASDDTEDIVAIKDRLDLHTGTACQMFRLPRPLDLRDPHGSAEAADWRGQVRWMGKGDRRRHLAKTMRFALLNAYDEQGVKAAKDVEELGLTEEEMVKTARLFLQAKPNMVAWKKAYAADAIAKGEARSLMGRRRKLFGSNQPEQYKEKFKTAVSHFLQGSEVDIMESCLLEVTRRYPECRLAWPSHDGLKIVFPTSLPVETVLPVVKQIVEQPRVIGKHEMPMYATWQVIREGGGKVDL